MATIDDARSKLKDKIIELCIENEDTETGEIVDKILDIVGQEFEVADLILVKESVGKATSNALAVAFGKPVIMVKDYDDIKAMKLSVLKAVVEDLERKQNGIITTP